MGEGKTIKGKTKSLAKNSIFYLIYNVLNVLFPFITGIYVARVLLPTDIGEVAYAQNIAQYFVILAFLGIPTYGLREISKVRNDKEELNKVHSELFLINLISTLIFSAIYVVVIFSVAEFRQNIVLYLIVGISIGINAINNGWLYEGLEEFGYISLRNILFKILAFVCLVIFVRDTSDCYIYAGITVIGTAGNYLLNIIHSRKFIKFRIKGLNLKRHLKPIFLLVVVNLAIEIYTLVDTTMLGILCNKENVAFYSYGSRINRIFLQIINTFTMVLVPRISLYYKEGRTDEFNELLTKTFKVIFILSVPLIIGIQFVSEFIICKLYGDIYINSAYVLKILSVVLLISPIGYLLGSRVLLVVGHEFKMVISVGIGAVVNIVGNLVLIYYLQEYGAALASIISEIVVMVIYVLLGKKYYHLNKWWDTVLQVAVASILMGGYLFACTFIPLNGWFVFGIQVAGAILIYFAVLVLVKESTVRPVFNRVILKFKKGKKGNPKESAMKELTLQEIQTESLKVLIKIKEICEENNIKYYLAYGTLIGAVRHHGFIPWDDDIDIFMPRPDFEKFIQYCIDHEELLKPFELKHYKTCEKYIYPIARFCDTRYKIDYKDAKDYGLGLFVDIYPLDGANPQDKRLAKKIRKYKRLVSVCGSCRFVKSPSALKTIFKVPYYIYTRFRNLNKVLRKIDRIAQKYDYNDSEYVSCIVWGSKISYDQKSWFDSAIKLNFENENFDVPIGYDELLRNYYHDYMKLPPENERIAHHFYKVYKLTENK